MSGDSSMLSDDERPLAPRPQSNGQGPVRNGNVNGQQSDVAMSDGDDDIPLVRKLHSDSI